MDSFFKRHFRKKEFPSAKAAQDYCRHRRLSAVVATSKARRRSSAGLPSAILMQRRRSSTQVQGSPLSMPRAAAKLKGGGAGRRRSSTTTPCLNPRFAVRRKRGSTLRTIDTHLLSPSMLLASLIHMTEEEGQGQSCSVSDCETEKETGMQAYYNQTQCSSGSESDGDLPVNEDSWSEAMSSESEEEAQTEDVVTETRHNDSELVETLYPALVEHIHTRPVIWPPQCLRRNSSHLLPAEFVYGKTPYGIYGNYRKISQRRRSNDVVPVGEQISAISRLHFGRHHLQRGLSSSRQASVAARNSVTAANHIPCHWRKRAKRRYENITHHATWDELFLYVYLIPYWKGL